MVNPIKKVFFDFIDKTITQQGQIRSVSKWESSEMYEIQVYLPGIDMQKWDTIPRIKVKVAEYEYRDYSPAIWNTAEKTCYLFIHASHNGRGSSWVKQLKTGQTFLFAPASAASVTRQKGPVLCLGDETALGHFLALDQLTKTEENPIDIHLSVNQNIVLPGHISMHNKLSFIKQENSESLFVFQRSLSNFNLSSYRSIYLAGHIPMVQGLRKILKSDQNVNARITSNGFWS